MFKLVQIGLLVFVRRKGVGIPLIIVSLLNRFKKRYLKLFQKA